MKTYPSRCALWLTLLWLLPILLIRAQPYHDSDLRASLAPPDGCSAPCFMGIRPGTTTTAEAIAILENHAWVAQVSAPDPDMVERPDTGLVGSPVVRWRWSELRPAWIAPEPGGELWTVDQHVRFLKISTQFSLGDVRLSLGNPDDEYTSAFANLTGHFWFYDGWYRDHNTLLATSGFCPLKLSDLYFRQTLLQFQASPPEFDGASSVGSACDE